MGRFVLSLSVKIFTPKNNKLNRKHDWKISQKTNLSLIILSRMQIKSRFFFTVCILSDFTQVRYFTLEFNKVILFRIIVGRKKESSHQSFIYSTSTDLVSWKGLLFYSFVKENWWIQLWAAFNLAIITISGDGLHLVIIENNFFMANIIRHSIKF